MDGELHLIALANVQCTPDLLGQRQLRLGTDLDPGTQAGRRLDLGGWHTHDGCSLEYDSPTLLLYSHDEESGDRWQGGPGRGIKAGEVGHHQVGGPASWFTACGIGVAPDYDIPLTARDLSTGHDPDIAKALTLLGG
jgi:hypothetical protein